MYDVNKPRAMDQPSFQKYCFSNPLFIFPCKPTPDQRTTPLLKTCLLEFMGGRNKEGFLGTSQFLFIFNRFFFTSQFLFTFYCFFFTSQFIITFHRFFFTSQYIFTVYRFFFTHTHTHTHTRSKEMASGKQNMPPSWVLQQGRCHLHVISIVITQQQMYPGYLSTEGAEAALLQRDIKQYSVDPGLFAPLTVRPKAAGCRVQSSGVWNLHLSCCWF